MSAAVPVKSGRRDWFRIIRDLAAVRDSAGVSLTMAYIARKVGRSKDAVQAWAEGSEPKESDARIVLALYAKHCPEKYRAHQAEYEIRVTEVVQEQKPEPAKRAPRPAASAKWRAHPRVADGLTLPLEF